MKMDLPLCGRSFAQFCFLDLDFNFYQKHISLHHKYLSKKELEKRCQGGG